MCDPLQLNSLTACAAGHTEVPQYLSAHVYDIWEDNKMADVTHETVNTIAKINIFSVLGSCQSAVS